MKIKYIIVGGRPFTMYTGTTTFTDLSVVGRAASKREAKQLLKSLYEQCGGLLIAIDLATGSPTEFQ